MLLCTSRIFRQEVRPQFHPQEILLKFWFPPTVQTLANIARLLILVPLVSHGLTNLAAKADLFRPFFQVQ